MRDNHIQACFRKAFGKQLAPAKYRECWAWPNEDPGKWAPTSYLIIYHECGLPNDLDYPDMAKAYDRLEAALSAYFGKKVFIEAHNAAVSTVWKV
jgi:hypothetical protein